jgi:hypothetical protein
MEEIQAGEIDRPLRGRMGLIVGPGFTYCTGILADLSTEIAERFEVDRLDS